MYEHKKDSGRFTGTYYIIQSELDKYLEEVKNMPNFLPIGEGDHIFIKSNPPKTVMDEYTPTEDFM